MAKNIVTLNLDNTEYSIRPYGVCTTNSDVQNKSVSIDDFSLCPGATVLVKFNNANTSNSPTLNVNNTGSYNIVWLGANEQTIEKNFVYEFLFNGSQWELLGSTSMASNTKDVRLEKYQSEINKVLFAEPSKFPSLTLRKLENQDRMSPAIYFSSNTTDNDSFRVVTEHVNGDQYNNTLYFQNVSNISGSTQNKTILSLTAVSNSNKNGKNLYTKIHGNLQINGLNGDNIFSILDNDDASKRIIKAQANVEIGNNLTVNGAVQLKKGFYTDKFITVANRDVSPQLDLNSAIVKESLGFFSVNKWVNESDGNHANVPSLSTNNYNSLVWLGGGSTSYGHQLYFAQNISGSAWGTACDDFFIRKKYGSSSWTRWDRVLVNNTNLAVNFKGNVILSGSKDGYDSNGVATTTKTSVPLKFKSHPDYNGGIQMRSYVFKDKNAGESQLYFQNVENDGTATSLWWFGKNDMSIQLPVNITKELTIKNSTTIQSKDDNATPDLIFKRGTNNDTKVDWRIADIGQTESGGDSNSLGYLKIQNRNQNEVWEDVLSLSPQGSKVIKTPYELHVGSNVVMSNEVSIGSGLTVTGNSKFISNAEISGDLTVGNSLTVNNFANFNYGAKIEANLTIGSGLTVTNNSTLNADVAIGRNLTVSGNTTLGDSSTDTTTVNATSTFKNSLTVEGESYIKKSLSINGKGNIYFNNDVADSTSNVISGSKTIIFQSTDTAGTDGKKNNRFAFYIPVKIGEETKNVAFLNIGYMNSDPQIWTASEISKFHIKSDASVDKNLTVAGNATLNGYLTTTKRVNHNINNTIIDINTGSTTADEILKIGITNSVYKMWSGSKLSEVTMNCRTNVVGNFMTRGKLSIQDSSMAEKCSISQDGSISAKGNLGVTGTSYLTGAVTAAGNLTVNGTLSISNEATTAEINALFGYTA